jgi:transposase
MRDRRLTRSTYPVLIVTMYVRKTTRRYKDKTYANYLLVESVHTPNGPRQKVVCSLGDLSPRTAEQWLRLVHKVEDALAGQINLFSSPDPEIQQIIRQIRSRQAHRSAEPAQSTPDSNPVSDLVAVHTNRVTATQHRTAGPIHVGLQFWKRLEFDTILRHLGFSTKAIQLTCAMTLNRLVYPRSEHAMPDWIRSTALGDILGVDFSSLVDDPLYRNLDRLHPNRAAIESALVERERQLFQLDTTVYLYDLTSTYFEGKAKRNPKAKRGYSRDKRPDCKQVVVGLVLNRDGFPKAHEVFDGNRQDRTTIDDMLAALEKRTGKRLEATVVIDRGMAYAENLEQIRARGLHYLVAGRQPERNAWLEEFEDQSGFEEVVRVPSPRNPAQKKSRVVVKRKEHDGEVYVLCISEGREEKDRAIREKHEERLRKDLQALEQRTGKGALKSRDKIHQAIGRLKERYPRVARYYTIDYDAAQGRLAWQENAARKALAEKLDGSYVLKTDRRDLTANEIWRLYILLTRVESAFRAMKSPLLERPIFHQLEHRTQTHIFLCVLAYHLLVAIEKAFLDRGVHTSWWTLRQTLATHQLVTVVLPTTDRGTLRIRRATNAEPQHREIYSTLGISHDVIRPIRTWTEAEA